MSSLLLAFAKQNLVCDLTLPTRNACHIPHAGQQYYTYNLLRNLYIDSNITWCMQNFLLQQQGKVCMPLWETSPQQPLDLQLLFLHHRSCKLTGVTLLLKLQQVISEVWNANHPFGFEALLMPQVGQTPADFSSPLSCMHTQPFMSPIHDTHANKSPHASPRRQPGPVTCTADLTSTARGL